MEHTPNKCPNAYNPMQKLKDYHKGLKAPFYTKIYKKSIPITRFNSI